LEQPVLRLGLIGFTAAETARVGDWLAREVEGWPLWSTAPFDKSDGWWIACRCISEFQGDFLTLQTGQAHQPWLKLNPVEIDRPIAFAGKLPTGMEASETVNPGLEASVRQQLQRFEAWLRPLRGQFALGADLIERESELKPGVYQVTLQGRLLAVLDLNRWRAGILPTARPVDFAQAVWDHRPAAANSIPEKFVQLSISQLMWIYASRTRRDVLPPRYRKLTVYFRNLPRLPVGWMHDEHLLLLREISARSGTLDDLVQRTGMGEFMLARHLAALYFAGAVTTNPRSASKPEPKRTPLGPESSQPLHVTPDGRLVTPSTRLSGFATHSRDRYVGPQDLTAPAPLNKH
jgi:hypothetical protein